MLHASLFSCQICVPCDTVVSVQNMTRWTMKKALLLAVLGLCGTAYADSYRLVQDPSGAPMCFTDSDEKAPLQSCQVQRHYTKANDPSGAPMCFNEFGGKAPLTFCLAPTAMDLLVSN